MPPAAFPAVQAAHFGLIARLIAAKPHRIVGGMADAEDLETRAEHLKTVLEAVAAYVRAVIDDTSENAALGAIDRRYINACLEDLAGDVAGSIAFAAEHAGRA